MSAETRVVIMAGGAGTRFWPASTKARPKQLLALVTERSLLLETIHRVAPAKVPYSHVIIVAGPHLEGAISQEIKGLGCQILVEPTPKNTAPCIAFAATFVAHSNPNAVLAILPADHHIADTHEFGRVFDLAVAQARTGVIATLGVHPTHPETGYGYVRRGAEVAPDVFKVHEFVEKPDLATAQGYLDDGGYDWNAGMFFMQANVALVAIDRHMPDLSRAMTRVSEAMGTDRYDDAIRAAFQNAKSISIDYGVMEKEAHNIVDIPCDAGWSDLGSWRSLLDFRDNEANFVRGDVKVHETKDCVVVSTGPHVSVLGLEGVAVVATKDAVIVTPLDRAQEVSTMVNALKDDGREDLT